MQDSSVHFVNMAKRLKILCECDCLSNTEKNPRARNFIYIFSSLAKKGSIVFWGSYCQFSLSMFVIRFSISMKETTRKIL